MIDRDEAEQLLEAGGHLFLGSGDDVGLDAGPVLRVYLDEYSGWPSFATVAAALPGKEWLVALHQAELREPGDGLQVPYDAATVDQAPTVGTDQDLTVSEEDLLFDYYGVPIDGVTPAVEHLGAALLPRTTMTEGSEVVEHDVDHPLSRL